MRNHSLLGVLAVVSLLSFASGCAADADGAAGADAPPPPVEIADDGVGTSALPVSTTGTPITCAGRPCVKGVVVKRSAQGVTIESTTLGVYVGIVASGVWVDTIGYGITIDGAPGSFRITVPARSAASFSLERFGASPQPSYRVDQYVDDGDMEPLDRVFEVTAKNIHMTSSRDGVVQPFAIDVTLARTALTYGDGTGVGNKVTLQGASTVTTLGAKGSVSLDVATAKLVDQKGSASFLGGQDFELTPPPSGTTYLGGQDFEVYLPRTGSSFSISRGAFDVRVRRNVVVHYAPPAFDSFTYVRASVSTAIFPAPAL